MFPFVANELKFVETESGKSIASAAKLIIMKVPGKQER
jgi:hypothetical protein